MKRNVFGRRGNHKGKVFSKKKTFVSMFYWFSNKFCSGIIAKDKSLKKQWYEFEDTSTYKYAHGQVKESKTASNK